MNRPDRTALVDELARLSGSGRGYNILEYRVSPSVVVDEATSRMVN